MPSCTERKRCAGPGVIEVRGAQLSNTESWGSLFRSGEYKKAKLGQPPPHARVCPRRTGNREKTIAVRELSCKVIKEVL
jgi:hypothetical protein